MQGVAREDQREPDRKSAQRSEGSMRTQRGQQAAFNAIHREHQPGSDRQRRCKTKTRRFCSNARQAQHKQGCMQSPGAQQATSYSGVSRSATGEHCAQQIRQHGCYAKRHFCWGEAVQCAR
jgi:hypothetical protein